MAKDLCYQASTWTLPRTQTEGQKDCVGEKGQPTLLFSAA